MKAVLLLAIACISASAHAHGFAERYDLPVPLGYVIAAACSAVFLTFLVAALFVRRPPVVVLPLGGKRVHQSQTKGLSWTWCSGLVKGLSWLLFGVTIVSALWGSADPLMNLAPTMIWIVWWIGLSFAVVLVGNVWPVLDPWRTTFDVLALSVRKLGWAPRLSSRWAWPARLGAWPAVFFLLLWCWLEVVYPIASSPRRLGLAALAWSAVSLTGMACFGRDAWQKHGDVFSLYFATLGRLAPLQFDRQRGVTVWCAPGQRLINPAPVHATGEVGFVMAMLSTVLFDGLHSAGVWTAFELALRKLVPHLMDVNGYFAGTTGLMLVWVVFLIAYVATCSLSARLTPFSTVHANRGLHVSVWFAPTLIPIAAGYVVAHNFSNLLIQGQTVFQLLSDPLGRQWDLFGTAKFYPDIGLVNARLTWYVAVVAIVAGHVLSIWLAHQLVLQLKLSPRRTALATAPLTCLMLAYTAVSLMVIAEPMVIYTASP